MTRFFVFLFGLISAPLSFADEAEDERKKVDFFEKLYDVKIEGVKPLEEYRDPDAFYSAIARQVGIPQLAFDAVEKTYGWKQSDEFLLSAMVKGGWDGDTWGVMVTKIPTALKDAETMEEKMKFLETMELKMVLIGYDGSVSFPEDPLIRDFGSSTSPDGALRLDVIARDKDIVDFEVFDSATEKRLVHDSIGWSAMRWFLYWETSTRFWGYGSDIGYFKVFEFDSEGRVHMTEVDITMRIPEIIWENLPPSLQETHQVQLENPEPDEGLEASTEDQTR